MLYEKVIIRLMFLIFLEIEDFLTEQECNDIILMAQTQGLERSMTLGEQSIIDETSGNSTNATEETEETFKSLDTNSDGHLDVGEVSMYVVTQDTLLKSYVRP